MEKYAVEVSNVSMKFNLQTERIDGLKEFLIKFLKNEIKYQEFWALDEVSFSIKKGEVFGLVGLNGAGKSTLLKLIAGIYKPTKGAVKAEGVIAPLIELGAGFDMELTARENIYLNGSVLGYNKEFLNSKFNEIVEFSEMQDFLDVPLKNYSSGMVARIAFAISTIVEPDILIVDEILSVGDFKFQEKCIKKISSMIDNGVTIIMVSHSTHQIKQLCNRVAYLEKGKLIEVGETATVLKKYLND
ncbi:ABC transporter ATP-binding protein [Paenibacillus hunanensis]|uniref:ABC-type polysaccharide/polyol phosphate transport system ATPase subunit n=1 Tax=Paenibacillus hunanensis TaxID=539262 RepID=A0ABU1IV62_9BACL|nr:ABC transporter ATP-binding protein [Paenibacillus hunanensis]MDR6242557.1 ABC-type polysaccharide/polyol phosphate transport system ATPase subunit [Paenibacillus hunanensis]GGJ00960.1 teichoic acid ABC transporter ATP-binding protein [Paenibacillus hunanensis]